MRFVTKRDLRFRETYIPAGTVVDSVEIASLEPFHRDAFVRRLRREKREGIQRGQLIVFRYGGGPRSAYFPEDLERERINKWKR